MFTLPPRPPDYYILRQIEQNATSGPEFTPDALPRITQATVGQYSYPIYLEKYEKPAKDVKIEAIEPQILDKWAKDARALWVDRPEENAPFLNEIFKKYTAVVNPNYNPTYKNRPKLFQRSYKYELECIEARRLELLEAKCKWEALEAEKAQKQHDEIQEAKVKAIFEPLPCKWQPPFWWENKKLNELPSKLHDGKLDSSKLSPDSFKHSAKYLRWQEPPNYMKLAIEDPCEKRFQMSRVGQSFKNEAINWYYVNYPPPEVKFRREKFT